MNNLYEELAYRAANPGKQHKNLRALYPDEDIVWALRMLTGLSRPDFERFLVSVLGGEAHRELPVNDKPL